MEEKQNKEIKAQGVETQVVKKENVTLKTVKVWKYGYDRMVRGGLMRTEHEKIIKELAQEAINKLGGL